jgi:hypothetical protein
MSFMESTLRAMPDHDLSDEAAGEKGAAPA